ncbi:hypothetical protein QJQ45_002208 [Haematococcus lacustris]|nr:hypothetical protein QJQ45_002208 [Haematococcus lacustris]
MLTLCDATLAKLDAQINSALRPNPFKKPSCHVSLSVAGLGEEDVADVFSGRTQLPVVQEGDVAQHVADLLLDVLTAVAAANPDVEVQLVDDLSVQVSYRKMQAGASQMLNIVVIAMQACGDAGCLAKHAAALSMALGGQPSTDGSLLLADAVPLHMQLPADQLYANELASLFAGLKSLEEQPSQPEGLSSAYGSDSKQVQASTAATKQMLKWAVSTLDSLYDGDVTFQVALFDSTPEQGVNQAVEYKERSRAMTPEPVLISTNTAAWLAGDELLMSKTFAAKAAGYGAFIIVLYFLLAGVYCLTFMPFKRDTLLFGSQKQDPRAVALRAGPAPKGYQHGITFDGGAPRRVVVTGMGLVTCLGNDVDTFYTSLLEGRSGITPIEGFDTTGYSTRFAGEIKSLDASGYVAKKMEKRIDKCIKYTMVAGKKALEHAGLAPDGPSIKDLNLARCGILMGSAFGGMTSFSNAVEALEMSGCRKMNPFCIPFAINNMGGALLAMDVGFMGPNYSISTACATGNYSIIKSVQQEGAEHILRGETDLMLAGASDAALIPPGMAGFIACKALSKHNDDPAAASRPWDRQRDGFVMGEGAGALVLEEYEHAKARGAPILAEYAGGAFTCDAHHMTEPHPDGRGVKLCLERALSNGGIGAQDVGYVNAHATSTPAGDMLACFPCNDQAEYRALTSVLTHPQLRMNSTKSMIGHLLGAAGAVEAIVAIKALQTGWLHPTINLSDPEEGVDMQRVCAGAKQHQQVDVALSNSFGFGGHNSCLIFKRAPA